MKIRIPLILLIFVVLLQGWQIWNLQKELRETRATDRELIFRQSAALADQNRGVEEATETLKRAWVALDNCEAVHIRPYFMPGVKP